MDSATIGILCATFGALVGCIGTGYGVHASIQNADTPERKEFVRKVGVYGVSALFVLMFAIVLAGNGMLPFWIIQAAMVAWFLLLGPVILMINHAYAKMGEPKTV